MVECENCAYSRLSKFTGYEGMWLCLHPFRGELDNTGHWSYPKIENPTITICKVPKAVEDERGAWEILADAPKPRWCYFDAVVRARTEQSGFDPGRQRQILGWSKEVRDG